MTLQRISTFLSHSSTDKPLVEAVGEELGKRGIVAWLDKDELYPGQSLHKALAEAIRQQATLTFFISPEALKRHWVDHELKTAIEHYKKNNQPESIKPVFLGNPLDLVKSHPLLSGWLNPEGTDVDSLGIVPDLSLPLHDRAQVIAKELAKSIFRSLDTAHQQDVVVNIDQRGSTRQGNPTLPDNHEKVMGCALVVRPRRGSGKEKETIVGQEWDNLAKTTQDGLVDALGGLRWNSDKKIFFSGNGQTGLAYLIGNIFNRSSSVTFYCHDPQHKNNFNNKDWDRTGPIQGGDPHCDKNGPLEQPAIPSTPFDEVVIIIEREQYYDRPLAYLESVMPNTPRAWVASPHRLETSQALHELVADVTALAQRLKRDNGCKKAYLVLGLPFAAVPIFAAHMPYVLDNFTLLEYRADAVAEGAEAQHSYAPLAFPS